MGLAMQYELVDGEWKLIKPSDKCEPSARWKIRDFIASKIHYYIPKPLSSQGEVLHLYEELSEVRMGAWFQVEEALTEEVSLDSYLIKHEVM